MNRKAALLKILAGLAAVASLALPVASRAADMGSVVKVDMASGAASQ